MPFYENIIATWGKHIYREVAASNIMNQQIFINKEIINLQTRASSRIRDIVRDGRILSHNEAKHKFHLDSIETFQYNSILAAINADQKEKIRQQYINNIVQEITETKEIIKVVTFPNFRNQ